MENSIELPNDDTVGNTKREVAIRELGRAYDEYVKALNALDGKSPTYLHDAGELSHEYRKKVKDIVFKYPNFEDEDFNSH